MCTIPPGATSQSPRVISPPEQFNEDRGHVQMTWFKVDDSFHSHPKVLATDADALGLWVVAGAWSSANLTDGFVPDHVLSRLLPDSDKLARKLSIAGLWKRVKGGHQFHDWADFQPLSTDVKAMREKRAQAGRTGGLASGRARSKRPSKTEASASTIVQPPSRPLPSTKEGRGDANSLNCRRHQGQPAHNCGPCRSEALGAS